MLGGDLFQLADHVVGAAAAIAAALSPVQVRVGLVEAESAVVGTTPPGDEGLDLGAAALLVGRVEQFPVGEGQLVQLFAGQQGAHWIAHDLAVDLEPPVGNGRICEVHAGLGRVLPVALQGIHQVQRGVLALADAEAVHAFPLDHLGEEGGMRAAKDGKDAGQLGPDALVQLQVPGMRPGIDGVAQHVGPQPQRGLDGVLLGRHNQADLVPRLL